jgi:glycosyltransferase involved in cell wall biosynthesis
MKFSVVIPVYNVKDYLRACIDSVLVQDCGDCEIILVDDGSTDGVSGGICDEYALAHPGLIRVIHQPNGGLGAARNTGIAASTGDYLVFLDSDDSLTPDALSALSQEIDETGADIYTFGFSVCREGRAPEKQMDSLPEHVVLKASEMPELLEINPSACNRIWKRELFNKTGISFPPRVWYEDIRTTKKLLVSADSIVCIHRCLYNYTVREESITRNTNVDRNSEIMDAFDDLIGWYKAAGLYDEYKEELSRLAAEHVLIAASVRVLRIDPNHPLLKRFSEYMSENFPDFSNNPRLSSLSRNQKMVLKLLIAKKYRLAAVMFKIKDAV